MQMFVNVELPNEIRHPFASLEFLNPNEANNHNYLNMYAKNNIVE